MEAFQYAPVSVIIPIYNSAMTIARAIHSILEQSQLPKEIICIDDASSDHLDEIINPLKVKCTSRKIDFKILRNEQNLGAGESRNRCWKLATQEYIAFLDADDSWHPKKIEIQFTYMHKNPKLIISAHRVTFNRKMEEPLQGTKILLRHHLSLLFKTGGSTPTLMVRREVPERFALLKTSEDRYLVYALSRKQKYLHLIEAPLATVYKPFFGNAGLSQSLLMGLKNDQLLFNLLFKENSISFFLWIAASIFNLLKIIRRILPIKINIH